MERLRKDNLFRETLDLRSQGEHSGAVELLSKVVAADKHHLDALFLLGSSLFSLDRFLEAIEAFRSVLGERPQNEPASLGLFHSFWSLGEYREAYNEMRRFLAIADSEEYERLLAGINEELGHSG
jgi:tetratricopeptide (TPR) repeat protein